MLGAVAAVSVPNGCLVWVCCQRWTMKGGVCQTADQMLLRGSERAGCGVEKPFTR